MDFQRNELEFKATLVKHLSRRDFSILVVLDELIVKVVKETEVKLYPCGSFTKMEATGKPNLLRVVVHSASAGSKFVKKDWEFHSTGHLNAFTTVVRSLNEHGAAARNLFAAFCSSSSTSTGIGCKVLTLLDLAVVCTNSQQAIPPDEQRHMFELGDCDSDGKIDLCDFLSLYSENPTAHTDDFLSEWRVWANAWAAEGKIATIVRLGTVLISKMDGEDEGDPDGGVPLQKMKSGSNPGMDPLRVQAAKHQHQQGSSPSHRVQVSTKLPFTLIAGEVVQHELTGVTYTGGGAGHSAADAPSQGQLWLTQYRLVFRMFMLPPSSHRRRQHAHGMATPERQFSLPLLLVSNLEHKKGHENALLLVCKHLRVVQFLFAERYSKLFVKSLKDQIERLAFPTALEKTFAFAHHTQYRLDTSFRGRAFTVEDGPPTPQSLEAARRAEGGADASISQTPPLRKVPSSGTAFLQKFQAWTELASASGNATWHDDRDGWDVYEVRREFCRQGAQLIDPSAGAGSTTVNTPTATLESPHPTSSRLGVGASSPQLWQLYPTASQEFYNLSPTYPQQYLIPVFSTQFNEHQLRNVAAFRARARLPVVVWVYPPRKRRLGAATAVAMAATEAAQAAVMRAEALVQAQAAEHAAVEELGYSCGGHRGCGASTTADVNRTSSNSFSSDRVDYTECNVLCRSSQPHVGLQNNRSSDDEALLNLYRLHGLRSDSVRGLQAQLYIVDCRSYVAAEANKFRNKGFEHAANYTNTKVLFQDIGNIHTMRDSLRKLANLLRPGSHSAFEDVGGGQTSWLSKLEATGWLQHVRLVLRGSVQVVRLLHNERASVLVHCSDGWDRTAQLCATAKLLLDPHYRTIEGFATLIEMEWLSFGHKFHDRLGHGTFSDVPKKPEQIAGEGSSGSVAGRGAGADSTIRDEDLEEYDEDAELDDGPMAATSSSSHYSRSSNSSRSSTRSSTRPSAVSSAGSGGGGGEAPQHATSKEKKEISPVFLQWLDVISQLLYQMPACFEFTEELLVFIADHAHSGLFGTFFGNSDRQRKSPPLSLPSRSCSIWEYVRTHVHDFRNLNYRRYDEGPLWPVVSPIRMRLWERYFLRWDPEMHPPALHGTQTSWQDDWGDGHLPAPADF